LFADVFDFTLVTKTIALSTKQPKLQQNKKEKTKHKQIISKNRVNGAI